MIEIVDNADTTSNIQVVSTHAHPLLFVPLLQTNPLSLLFPCCCQREGGKYAGAFKKSPILDFIRAHNGES